MSLVGLIILVFFMARLTGSPADLYLPIDAPNEMREQFAKLHGLNDPLIVQFARFLADAARLDFGQSLRQGRPALALVLEAFPTTLQLALFSMTLALAVAIVTGALAAWRPNGAFDRIASLISLAGASIPNFWLAIVGVLVFAVMLRWVPTSGIGSVQQWVLPVAALFIRPCGLIVQVVRNSMIGALSSAYVKTARAKGVKSRSIIFVHALRNAMLPVITVAGDQLAGIINGAVVVETIFGFPGIGKLMIDSITYRDFAVIQAGVLVTAIAVFALNVAIDLGYALLDPRIRHA
jgi:peptide/nickel transport system permease protein